MRLVTERDLIRGVAEAWKHQYPPHLTNEEKRTIGYRLSVLDGDTATADDIEAIIGNRSWTRLKCDECGVEAKAVIEVGQELDYESRTAELCADCARKAAALAAGF